MLYITIIRFKLSPRVKGLAALNNANLYYTYARKMQGKVCQVQEVSDLWEA